MKKRRILLVKGQFLSIKGRIFYDTENVHVLSIVVVVMYNKPGCLRVCMNNKTFLPHSEEDKRITF